jgi:flagellar basal-body rod protein FlgF
MLRGLYTAATGLSAIMRRNEIETNNLINSNTNGYKKEEVVFKSFYSHLTERINYERPSTSQRAAIGTLGKGVMIDEVVTYFDLQGQLVHTGQDMDLAIHGDGYLVVQDPQGENYYTRNCSLMLDPNSRLTTGDGNLVMGKSGPIEIRGQQLAIHEDGQVYCDGEYVDTLLMVDLVNPKKVGNSLITSDNPPIAATGKFLQGYIEKSNANPIEGMTNYLKNLRAYESNQKIVQAYDSTLDKAVNEVGKA